MFGDGGDRGAIRGWSAPAARVAGWSVGVEEGEFQAEDVFGAACDAKGKGVGDAVGVGCGSGRELELEDDGDGRGDQAGMVGCARHGVESQVGIHGESEAAIAADEVAAEVSGQQHGLPQPDGRPDGLRQMGLPDVGADGSSPPGSVDGEWRDGVRLFPCDVAGFLFAFERGCGYGREQRAVPSDAGLAAAGEAGDVVVEIAEGGGVEIDAVDVAGRVGLAEAGWVLLDEDEDLIGRDPERQELSFVPEGFWWRGHGWPGWGVRWPGPGRPRK